MSNRLILGLLLLALASGPGCLDFSGNLTEHRKDLLDRRSRMEADLKKTGHQALERRDALWQQKNLLEVQIEQFRNYLQHEGLLK